MINIFGGITRCDDVAIGLLQAFEQINSNIPVIVRLTGTNEHIGRELLRNYSRFQIATTMKEDSWLSCFFNPDRTNGYLSKYEFGLFYAHRFAPDMNVASKFIYEQEDIA